MIKICSSKVYIINGPKFQTINIFSTDWINLFDYTIRIHKPNAYVSEHQLSVLKFNSLKEFVELLKNKYKGIIEKKLIDINNLDPDKRNLKITILNSDLSLKEEITIDRSIDQENILSNLLVTEETPIVDGTINQNFFSTDLWLKEAIPVVEKKINDFIKLFIKNPFLHRHENSINCELYKMLLQSKLLNEYASVNNFKIRLIQKEWPAYIQKFPEYLEIKDYIEYECWVNRDNRNAADFIILSPSNLKNYNIDDYKNGTIKAPITIEIGLNREYLHFEKAWLNLATCNIYKGYIIHLVRETEVTKEDDFNIREHLILSIEKSYPNIKIAYVRFGRDGIIYKKLLGDKTITSIQYRDK